MKIYVVIVPWDYQSATAEVFKTRKDAEEFLAEQPNANYGSIEEKDI